MIINIDNMRPEEVNSHYHKVRAVVFDCEGKMFLASMEGTYTLPGGGVEENENIEAAIIRELKEELGIDVSLEELSYLGNYKFYHKNFPDFQGKTNRLNEIDLFLIDVPKNLALGKTHFTEREKKEKLKIIATNVEDIEVLLTTQNNNPYKKALDEELRVFLEIIKEREKDVRKKI